MYIVSLINLDHASIERSHVFPNWLAARSFCLEQRAPDHKAWEYCEVTEPERPMSRQQAERENAAHRLERKAHAHK